MPCKAVCAWGDFSPVDVVEAAYAALAACGDPALVIYEINKAENIARAQGLKVDDGPGGHPFCHQR